MLDCFGYICCYKFIGCFKGCSDLIGGIVLICCKINCCGKGIEFEFLVFYVKVCVV